MLLVSLFSFFVGSSHALSIPFTRRASPTHSTTVTINPHYNGNLGFSNADDFLYSATIYVQGQPFQVQIDSGSSDLWLNTEGVTFNGLVDTGINATITYVDTTAASGPVMLGNVSFGEFTVEGQAFINAPGSNASTPGIDSGLLGVGPPFASAVLDQLTAANSSFDGLPFLTNVFNLNPNEPSFITFLLSRSDLGITEGGVMTIAELVANYTSVTSMPKLPVVSQDSWETFMDGVYVNGKFFTGHSLGASDVVTQPGKDQTTIVLDTGTSLATAPPYYVDAMYKDLPGAVYEDSLQTYKVPCHTKVNISMVFGSNTYPINPIDATSLTVNENGSFWCQGTFSYSPSDAGVDFILGDGFMRNVYTLLNYGANFTGHGDANPFMQILSITDADQAWADFDWLNIQRIVQQEYTTFSNSTPSEAAPQSVAFSLVAPSSTASATRYSSTYASVSTASHVSSAASSAAPSSSASTGKVGEDLAAAAVQSSTSGSSNVDLSGLKRNTYIIMGLLVAVIVLLIGVLVKLIRASKNSRYTQVPTIIPPVHYDKAYQSNQDDFSTPYDDLARPLPS